eukprot:gene15073-biopygen1047
MFLFCCSFCLATLASLVLALPGCVCHSWIVLSLVTLCKLGSQHNSRLRIQQRWLIIGGQHSKLVLVSQVQHLNHQRQQQQHNTQAAVQRAAAAAAVHAAHQQLAACDQPAVPAALDALVTARHAFASIQASEERVAQQRRRQQWVHNGERPGPLLSQVLKPPKAATFIAGLTAPGNGHLVVDGVGLANIVASRYATVTAAAQVQPQAQQQVLQALHQYSTPLPPQDAAALGATEVTEAEVAAAIAALAPGKAPGLDGIPGKLFRRFKQPFARILSRLYSAIGSVNRVPAAFLDGMIVPVLKPGGILVDVDSYRPLQMLSYDYRLLAKVLANRLASAANSIIDPAQCAFVPRRSIGDSIRLLQLLAPMLRAEQRAAVVAFLDFRKAYDTVDREFLCSVAATLDVGAGFVSWMRLLMTNTCLEQPLVSICNLQSVACCLWVLFHLPCPPCLSSQLLGPVPGGGVWSLALCDRGHLFSGTAVLPLVNPLRSLAVGLRALPPLQYVGDEDALPPGSWCWHAPLWSNPFLVRTQTWQWFGKQREVVVGLECEAPAGLLHLPALQTVGQAVCLLIKLQLIDQLPGGLPARRTEYQRDVWGPVLRDYPPYADRFLALAHVRQLLSWIPSPWLTAAVAVYNAAQAAGSHPPACTVDSIADARQHLS